MDHDAADLIGIAISNLVAASRGNLVAFADTMQPRQLLAMVDSLTQASAVLETEALNRMGMERVGGRPGHSGVFQSMHDEYDAYAIAKARQNMRRQPTGFVFTAPTHDFCLKADEQPDAT